MDQNITRTATITLRQDGDKFTVFTAFDPPIPDDRKQDEITICEAATMTALMAIKMWWENINNEQKEAQGEQSN